MPSGMPHQLGSHLISDGNSQYDESLTVKSGWALLEAHAWMAVR